MFLAVSFRVGHTSWEKPKVYANNGFLCGLLVLAVYPGQSSGPGTKDSTRMLSPFCRPFPAPNFTPAMIGFWKNLLFLGILYDSAPIA